jgi:hypothetical protein
MNSNTPFDDFVKKQFSDYSPNVPEHVWKNIIAKRRSKPKGFWINFLNVKNILILSAVLLTGGGIAYYLSSNKIENKNTIAAKNNSDSQKNISSSEKNNRTSNTNKTASQESDPLSFINTKADDQSSAKQKTTTSNNKNKPAKNNDVYNFSSLISQSHINKIKDQNNLKEENTNTAQIPFISENETKTNNLFNENAGKLMFPPLFNTIELTGTKFMSLHFKSPDCPSIEKNAAGNKTYWEIYAGPDHTIGSYKTYGDTASNNYLQKRKASTQLSSAFSAGVRYTKVFDNGMSVRTGLNYSQINEKFSYFNPNEIKLVTVITTRVIIRQPGDTVYINDTLQYQQTGTRTKTTYNRYHTIDVPLLIGYELGNGKIHANINAGVIINIYSWYKGDVLDSLYQPVSITTGKGNSVYQFKNNIGIGFLGSVSVYYKLTDKLHLLLEPFFRYNLSPMSKENLNLQQKFNTAGLRAGVRFDLK